MKRFLLLFAGLAAALCFRLAAPLPAAAYDRITGRDFATRSEVIARHGMAATSQPLATQIGARDPAGAGGNAVDAAIAANAVLGLMEPTGCGLGGDLFAIVWDAKTKKLYGLNGSAAARPASLTLDHFKKLGLTHDPAARTAAGLGARRAWTAGSTLHERFGKLPMTEVLAPAIRYAREGFPVSELIAYLLAAATSARLAEYPRASRRPSCREGSAPKKGEIFKNPALADDPRDDRRGTGATPSTRARSRGRSTTT